MSASRDARRPPPPAPAPDWALFLDIDGCLLDFAESPDAVVVPTALPSDLEALAGRLGGAVALISGRAIGNIDRLFGPSRWPVAGLHGLELRSDARVVDAPPTPSGWASVREGAARLVDAHPGTLLEDKGAALALHWRKTPEAAAALRAFAESTLTRLPGYRLQPGDHVIEIRPDAGDKGTAIIALLEEPPFRGRLPVFVGDDVTDESGFAAINARNGLSVLVGHRAPSCARYALPDPAAVRAWLTSSCQESVDDSSTVHA
jgi:trehalose 6-phosphate phosphatase